MVLLNGKLNFALLDLQRAESNLNNAFETAFEYEERQHLRVKGSSKADSEGVLATIKSSVKEIEPILFKVATFVTAVLSLYVIACELLIMFQFDTPLILSSYISMVSLVLAYLAFTTYYGLFNIRIFSIYNLDSSGHTDSFSLLYSARTLTGLASPLCFNFLKLTNVSHTQFIEVLNPLDAIPVLGASF